MAASGKKLLLRRVLLSCKLDHQFIGATFGKKIEQTMDPTHTHCLSACSATSLVHFDLSMSLAIKPAAHQLEPFGLFALRLAVCSPFGLFMKR
jgi:hypothetical protein